MPGWLLWEFAAKVPPPSTIMAPMAMTETFAATAAQTIPVFALAGVLELRALKIVGPSTPKIIGADTPKGIATLVTRFLGGLLWMVLIVVDYKAEAFCLDYLRHRPIAQGADLFTQRAMLGSLAALIFTPILAWTIAPVLLRYELEFKAARARKQQAQEDPKEGHGPAHVD